MPPKVGIIAKSREVIDLWLLRLPWPNINPSYISFLAIPFSLAFVLVWEVNKLVAFVLLVITLIFDWLDGIIAKKHQRTSEKGWLIDVATDRVSEGIIFLKFFEPWFYLYLFNVFLSVYFYYHKKMVILLPLRQLLFLYLILLYSFYFFFSP